MNGHELKDIRLVRFRLSQAKMAVLFDVSLSTFKRWEQKKELSLIVCDSLGAKLVKLTEVIAKLDKHDLYTSCGNVFISKRRHADLITTQDAIIVLCKTEWFCNVAFNGSDNELIIGKNGMIFVSTNEKDYQKL